MRPYTYSGVYDVNDKNKSIFTDNLKDHVSSVLDGYNCTILAYGITGSGKTYTVFGPNNKKYNSNNNTNNNNNSNSNSNLNINNINNNNNLQSNFNTFNANANNNATNNINNNNENI
jgi:type II secretory ATPase GspE/PulE/Tfp pilus assembly ATPase PilB-like protein